ncbi:unnamed protein product, partial [Hapterophycus canaliculatus]
PVSAAALSRLFQQGEVDGMSMAWTTGMGDWKPLREVHTCFVPTIRPSQERWNAIHDVHEATAA